MRAPGRDRHADASQAASHWAGVTSGPHAIQGLGAGFVPEILNRGVCDEISRVTSDAALEAARRMTKAEGRFVGISADSRLGRSDVTGARIISGAFVRRAHCGVILG